jgi:hypothetical protein
MPKEEEMPMGASLPNSKACKVVLFKPAVISRRLLLLHERKESCVRGRSGGGVYYVQIQSEKP